jgi:hypothetical protein
MGRVAETWNQAHRGLEILLPLRTEWLPNVSPPAPSTIDRPPVLAGSELDISPSAHLPGNVGAAIPIGVPPPVPEESADLPMDLHEWLITQDFHDVIFSGETSAWTGAALGIS